MRDTPADTRVLWIFSSILDIPVSALGPESSRDTVEEWDSIKHMYLILALEEEFQITFDDDEIASLESLPEILGAILVKTGQDDSCRFAVGPSA